MRRSIARGLWKNDSPLLRTRARQVRCFTCGKVIGNQWERFQLLVAREHDSQRREGVFSDLVGPGDRTHFATDSVSCALVSCMCARWCETGDRSDGFSAEGAALNRLGFTRYCCRRMFLGHVNMIDNLLEYEQQQDAAPAGS